MPLSIAGPQPKGMPVTHYHNMEEYSIFSNQPFRCDKASRRVLRIPLNAIGQRYGIHPEIL